MGLGAILDESAASKLFEYYLDQARRRADEAVLHGLDRGERADAVDEAGSRFGGEIVAEPEIDGVGEHECVSAECVGA